MARTTVRRWEYKTLRPSRNETKKEAADPQDALNEYGDDGWELAGTIEYTGGGTKFLVFKRPAETADESDEMDDRSSDAGGRASEADGGTEEMDTVSTEEMDTVSTDETDTMSTEGESS